MLHSGEEDPLDRVFLYDASSCSISKKACDGLDRSAMCFLSSRVSAGCSFS